MKLSDFKNKLRTLNAVSFVHANGKSIPSHFHITEVGSSIKHFIDCGGTIRDEKAVTFQLWEANDLDHRLSPEKLLGIIELSEKKLGIKDLEIEVEYQSDTIGKYGLEFSNDHFILTVKQTNCLAQDKCGIPAEKLKVNLSTFTNATNCCTPGSGCC